MDNPSIVATELLSDDHFIIKPYKSQKALAKIMEIVHDEQNDSNLVLYGEEPLQILEAFDLQFKRIDAAGGVVINEKDEILMIHRRGFWDLPKGKLDEGETLEAAAVREVKEETGLINVDLLSPITFEGLLNKATYHSYEHKGIRVLKASYWYMMKGNSTDKIIPQTDEDIIEARWMSRSEVEAVIPEMYLSIQDVIREVFR